MFEDEPHAEGAAVVAAAGEALQALCQELNLDEGSAAEALDDFTAIRGNYSLEVSGGRWGGRTLARPHPGSAPTLPSGAVGVSPPWRVAARPGAAECETGRGSADHSVLFFLRRESEVLKRSGLSKVPSYSGSRRLQTRLPSTPPNATDAAALPLNLFLEKQIL